MADAGSNATAGAGNGGNNGGGTPTPNFTGPVSKLLDFAVFRIDALGLVTMLGADEVNNYHGQLLTNVFVDWMPQLGGFIIAGSKFRAPQPGFELYNLNVGIKTTDMASWLTRWLMARDDFYRSISVVELDFVAPRNTHVEWLWSVVPFFIGLIFNGGLLSFAVLQSDLWGSVNTCAMIGMILVRQSMLWQTRTALDRSLAEFRAPVIKAQRELEKVKAKHPGDADHSDVVAAQKAWEKIADIVDMFCILPSGNLVTLRAPAKLVQHGFTQQITIGQPMLSTDAIDAIKLRSEWCGDFIERLNAQYTTRTLYRASAWLAWIFFGVHVVFIGQADLAVQLVTVGAILGSTLIITYKIGCNDNYIASSVCAKRTKATEEEEKLLFRWLSSVTESKPEPELNPDKRVYAYTRIVKDGIPAEDGAKLEDRMQNLLDWQLVPQPTNRNWHDKYPQYVQHWAEYDRKTKAEVLEDVRRHEKQRRDDRRLSRKASVVTSGRDFRSYLGRGRRRRLTGTESSSSADLEKQDQMNVEGK